MNKKDGMNYAPKGKPNKVVEPGKFIFSAVALDHGHIYGMTNGLLEAGATIKWVYDPDEEKVKKYLETFPDAKAAESEEQVLNDEEVNLIASAAIPCERADLGIRVMKKGKDYFTDKAPMTTLEQLDRVKATIKETGKIFSVYYSERIHTECSVYAGDLVKQGAIGKVIQVLGMGPHRLSHLDRPAWFFERDKYGGILCDIGSHQIEQFLFFTGATDAKVLSSKVANYNHKDLPGLEDFGDATLLANNGATGYFRVDWFTPDGLSTWGDGRMFILGTEGYIELRKYVDVAKNEQSDNVYWVNGEGENYINVHGKVGFPFFGQLVLDCINRTENSMTQEHTLKAAELCIKAQMAAIKIGSEE